MLSGTQVTDYSEHTTLFGIRGGAQMPWHECFRMDERLRFVARLIEGEKMAVL